MFKPEQIKMYQSKDDLINAVLNETVSCMNFRQDLDSFRKVYWNIT